MTAKQTPLVDILRLHAEDLHNDYGHNKSARLLSQAADEIERLRSNSLALEDEKNDYMDGVGDVLKQDHDGETLWAAAQRVMSECDRLRAERDRLRAERDAAELMSLALNAELAELRKPDCFRCAYWFACRTLIKDDCGGGDKFVPKRDPVRLYEKEGQV